MRRAIVLIAALLALAGCGDGASASGGPSADDPATHLAQLDGSTNLSAYSTALDAWQAKCKQDRVTDAGYVDSAFRDEQKNNGPDSSRLVVMQNLTASVPADVAPTDCAGITAGYLVEVEPAG